MGYRLESRTVVHKQFTVTCDGPGCLGGTKSSLDPCTPTSLVMTLSDVENAEDVKTQRELVSMIDTQLVGTDWFVVLDYNRMSSAKIEFFCSAGCLAESCREDMRDGSMRPRIRATRPAPPLPSRAQSARRHNPGL